MKLMTPRIETSTSNNEMSGTRELGAQPKQLLFDPIFAFGTKNKLKISILSWVFMVQFGLDWIVF